MDTTSNHFVHRPLAAVLWSELPGLERSFDEEIVAFFVRRGDVGEVAVKHQAVPVGVFLRLGRQDRALRLCEAVLRLRPDGRAVDWVE